MKFKESLSGETNVTAVLPVGLMRDEKDKVDLSELLFLSAKSL